MPRNVRNFWIELDVDGVSRRIATGPQSKDGGFRLTIRQRDGGGIITALDVQGNAGPNGRLTLMVEADRTGDGVGYVGEGMPQSFRVITSR